ncbi:MAG TPA: DUF1998 domain-containing protein [Bacteriovoracaceae bacterium]|nr:DUF1998 domain-containing protein [Bacteriovoracaceae bacterium]
MSNTSVGQVRPSQLLWTYGPGALVDLPNLSVITMGLNRWDTELCPPLEEARLLSAVQRVLGQQVVRLRMPPVNKNDNVDPFTPEAKIGVPVKPFPRWLRCVKCGLLADYESGLFTLKESPYRPERTQFIHTNCSKGNFADAVPARFLMACRNGHLDDFPWHWFVHAGPSECRGTLRFYEMGASLQTENLWVQCDTCGNKKNMAHAFGKIGQQNLPACRGRHPHLDHFEADGCTEDARAVLLGATNSWFPMTISVLAIPLEGNPIQQILLDNWNYFQDTESEDELKIVLKTLSKAGQIPGIDKYTANDIWKGIQQRNNNSGTTEVVTDGDIKTPEWEVLTSSNPPTNWPHFFSRKTDVPKGFQNLIQDVLLLERLREVNALIGYTRVEAPEETDTPDERPPMAELCRGNPTWVPATEVHGEGIFIRFNESELATWEQKQSVKERDQKLFDGHKGWRNSRKLDPNVGYPRIRYAMLHTFAHLLIRELALECGYNASSIRERIYATTGNDNNMAGVLLYTAAADSDGTLGGLVELGKPEYLGRIIQQALSRAEVCASDPLCSEHDPSKDRSLHLASCHACTLVAETSCERGNRYLDRALLVKTFENSDSAFFET